MERCLVDNIIYPDKEMIKVEEGYVHKSNYENYLKQKENDRN